MTLLVACERTGTVRDAFIAAGYDAVSCDILPSDVPGPHLVGDARDFINDPRWRMLIAFPPCTYLSSSGLHRNKSDHNRAWKTQGPDKGAQKVRETIEYLLRGPETIRLEDRLSQLIEGKKVFRTVTVEAGKLSWVVFKP